MADVTGMFVGNQRNDAAAGAMAHVHDDPSGGQQSSGGLWGGDADRHS